MRFLDAVLWWLLSIAAVIGWKFFRHGSVVASEIVASGIAGGLLICVWILGAQVLGSAHRKARLTKWRKR
jgi:hypothetical protein